MSGWARLASEAARRNDERTARAQRAFAGRRNRAAHSTAPSCPPPRPLWSPSAGRAAAAPRSAPRQGTPNRSAAGHAPGGRSGILENHLLSAEPRDYRRNTLRRAALRRGPRRPRARSGSKSATVELEIPRVFFKQVDLRRTTMGTDDDVRAMARVDERERVK